MVRDLLQGFVPEQWVSHLDFSSLEKVNASYVSEELLNRADDIVWRVRLADECKGPAKSSTRPVDQER